VGNTNGKLVAHCFEASCCVSGAVNSDMSVSDIEASFANLYGSKEKSNVPFVVPEWFVTATSCEAVLEYLHKNNCLAAFYEGRVDIKYDPRMHRVVFMCKKGGEYVGATGRALDRITKPKWFIYGDGGVAFFVGSSGFDARNCTVSGEKLLRWCVLVEDCASACAVSSVMDAFALLGTNLASLDFKALAAYQTVYVALDKDASAKAIDLQRELCYYHDNVKVILLEEDLKYCSQEKIRGLLGHA
jgi:hypothetical protein